MCSRARPVNTVAAAAPSATRVAEASHGTTRAAAARRGTTRVAAARGGLLQLKHFFVDQLADVSFPERLLVYVLCT